MKEHEHIKPNEITEQTKTSMKTRIIAALVGAAIIVPPFIIGDWFFLILTITALVIGLVEIVNTAKKDYSVLLYVMTLVVGVLITYWPVMVSCIQISHGVIEGGFSPHIYSYFRGLSISVPALFVGICLLFLTVVLHESFTVRDACFLIAMVVVIAIGIQSMLYLRYLPCYLNNESRELFNHFDNFSSSGLVVYVIFGAFFTDIGAYFTGVLFGHKKINERISPKKTYGGFVGGLVFSAVLTMAIGFVAAALGHPILTTYMDLPHWWNIVIVSLIMPLFATLGDFVFSAIKRHYNVKDFGKLIPGHGGILDRLDSMMFTALGAATYLSIYIAFFEKTYIL